MRELGRFDDLRGFIALCEEIGECRTLEGAERDLEIGCLYEMAAERHGPALLFDRIPHFPAGFRVFTNAFASLNRTAALLRLPVDGGGAVELLDRWRRKVRQFTPVAPEEVASGPVFQNRLRGGEVDLGRFPAPRWHERDGGPYIGTADCVITSDPDSGAVNMGTYRVMVQGPNTCSVKANKGKDARIMMEKYHARGQSCPMAITFGQDPTLYPAAFTPLPYGTCELDFSGWLAGAPIQVVRGPITGLPIPATAEIAIEGFVPPLTGAEPQEGPFGEWAGYYTDTTTGEVPVMEVEGIYFRDDPILHGQAPLKPPRVGEGFVFPVGAADVWNALERAGVPDVKGVWGFVGSSLTGFVTVVAIRQRYAGHAKQAGIVATGCRPGAYGGRIVIVVDDDIDVSDPQDVFWALGTRCNVRRGIDIVKGVWTTPADPTIGAEMRRQRNYVSDRLIVDACKPYASLGEFPETCSFGTDMRDRMRRRWPEIVGG